MIVIKGLLKNRLILLLVFVILLTFSPAAGADDARLVGLCRDFNVLNSNVRDGAISKAAAKAQFTKLIESIGAEYYVSGAVDYPRNGWSFPLKGYDLTSIGGVNGSGYQEGGYDYFDGNRHSGHPSHDLFILDRKQVCLDEVTKKPVSVLSVTGGVVVAAEKDWQPDSPLRGGKYIWIYDPASQGLVYYAHNDTLKVTVGDVVRPGDVIAEVGRTGLNAYKKRSPTHLHITFLSVSSGLPVPQNTYQDLLNCKLDSSGAP